MNRDKTYSSTCITPSFKDELSTIDDQQKNTIEDISKLFQSVRSTFAKMCDKCEHTLLLQAEEIYSSKRSQLVNLFTNEGRDQKLQTDSDTLVRMSKFLNGRPAIVDISKDLKAFEASTKRFFDLVQLQSPADTCQKELSCVAGFTKTISENALNDNGNNTTDINIPVILNTDTNNVTFTAPAQPGEITLNVNHGDILCRVSIRPYPLKLDVPHCELIRANARFCTINNSKLYVTSRMNPFVNVCDISNGARLKPLGGEFKKARGLVVTDDSIFVASAIRSEVAIIPKNSESVKQWFGKESGLEYPLGMKMSPDGRLFVTSMKNKRIIVFRKMEDKWEKDNELKFKYMPYDLAFDSSNNIHVALGDDNEQVDGVHVYNAAGDFVRIYGEYGEKKVYGVGGIAIDKYDHSYVTEYRGDGRLTIFDNNGRHVSSSLPLNYPMGVCIDEDGSVFVASNLSHRILVF